MEVRVAVAQRLQGDEDVFEQALRLGHDPPGAPLQPVLGVMVVVVGGSDPVRQTEQLGVGATRRCQLGVVELMALVHLPDKCVKQSAVKP